MTALAPGDSERLLNFVAEAESFGGDHPFDGEFLTQLGRLVPADWIAYCDCYGRRRDAHGPHFDRRGDEGFSSGLDRAGVKPVVDEESPVFLHIWQGSSGAAKLSDFLNRRDLHRTRLYHLAMKPLGLEDTLGVRLRIGPRWQPKQFVFERGGRGFSARDRAVLDLLQPHLVQLHRASESKKRLREALAVHESTQTAVVLLEADDRVAFASTAAKELLDRFFGENGAGLPHAVVSWLAERRRRTTDEPLRIDAGGRALIVELVDGALLLEEQQHLPRLTPRECEIMDLVAEGRTNAEIAERLWISPATVRKHLENVYAKLGVHTRTAAAALVGGRLRPFQDR